MEGTTKIISVIKSLLKKLRNKTEDLGVNYVLDYVPEEKVMPYIVLGEVGTMNDGTKKGFGESINIDIEIWSKNKGKYKDLNTAKKIQELLLEDLESLEGEEEFQTVYQDATTITSRELDFGIFLTVIRLKIRIM